MADSADVPRKHAPEEKEAIALSFLNGHPSASAATKQELRSPNFDFWSYENEPAMLLELMKIMYDDLGLTQTFSIPSANLENFLRAIYLGYNDNPYHNFNHCFCVTQMMYAMINGMGDSWFTDIEKLVLMTAAVCHDLDHPGTNNAFQKKAHTWFVDQYPDSYLERHHWNLGRRILSQPENNIFVSLSAEDREMALSVLEKLILATDMALHQHFVSSFKEIVNNGTYDINNPEHRQLVMQLMLKTCDISNEARPLAFTEGWLKCLLEEFFQQGDLEKEQGLPVDALMDRAKVEKNSSQVGFIEFVSLPLFEELGRVIPLEPMIENLKFNLGHYKKRKEEMEASSANSQ